MVEPCPRSEVLGAPKECLQTQEDCDVVERLGIIEGHQTGARGQSLDTSALRLYMLCLGQIYKRIVNLKTNKTKSTGWFVFLDVAKKDKPVYLIWREKTYGNDILKAIATYAGKLLGFEPGTRPDFFRSCPASATGLIIPTRMSYREDRIQKGFEQNAQELHLTFTRPLYGYMVERIADGWGKADICDKQTKSLVDGVANRTTTKATNQTTNVSKAMTRDAHLAPRGPVANRTGGLHSTANRPVKGLKPVQGRRQMVMFLPQGTRLRAERKACHTTASVKFIRPLWDSQGGSLHPGTKGLFR